MVAVVGDGALTGGMAYEALNNLGHSGRRVVIVLNDNGRSYAPTVSQLSQSLTTCASTPRTPRPASASATSCASCPGFGELAYSGVHGLTSALREMVAPHTFFEALGVRYAGPIDGHDIEHMEQAFAHAAEWSGPIVVHVLTQKGRGYAPAEEDDVQRLHDVKASIPVTLENSVGSSAGSAVGSSSASDGGGVASPRSVPEIEVDGGRTARRHLHRRLLPGAAEPPPKRTSASWPSPRPCPGPTGLLPFQARFPDRFFDVGIAEQHEVTAAAGMAMAGLRPVVAVYSTFLSRAFDQANLDVGLHGCPVVFVLDRAGITGDDGPSHHGVLDLALALSIPGMTVFAPSAAEEVEPMLPGRPRAPRALDHPRPQDGTAPRPCRDEVGRGLEARRAPGRATGRSACSAWARWWPPAWTRPTSWPPRGSTPRSGTSGSWSPPDPGMLADAGRHQLVVTVEDGVRYGGAGAFLVDSMAAQIDSDRRIMPATRVLGIPRQYLAQGKADEILASLGLDGAGIAESVRRVRLEVLAVDRAELRRHRLSPPASETPATRVGQARFAPCWRTKSFTA